MLLTRLSIALAVISTVAGVPLPMHGLAQRQDAAKSDSTVVPVLIGGPGDHSTATNSSVIIGGGQSDNNGSTIPQGGGPKLVVAHFMLGNAYSYTKETWKKEIAMALSGSIDGFALNIGSDSWQPDRVSDAYAAAKEMNTDFKLFISFDMTVLPQDGAALRPYISKYANHPNQLKYNGKSFASTFAGEGSTFGHGSAADGWHAEFIQPLESAGTPVWFVPALFVSPQEVSSTWSNSADGIMTWNSGWPIDATSKGLGVIGAIGALASQTVDQVKGLVGSFKPDADFISAVKGGAAARKRDGAEKTYLATVSPFFFTHYGPDTWDKNWLYVSDDHLYTSRWDTLIANRDKVDIVEIVTWNDYGESSYIGGIGADQPKSNAWVDGYDHTALIPLTSYYATAFKTGKYPEIKKDSVVLAARPHTKTAIASADGVGRPTNWELVQDKLWADFLLTEPATVTLETAAGKSQSWEATAGAGRFSFPLTVGGYIKATVTRNGQTALTCQPKDFQFTDRPQTYNFNSFVAGCEAD